MSLKTRSFWSVGTFHADRLQLCGLNCIVNKLLVPKETVVLGRWESGTKTWFHQTVKIWKADVSSYSPSSERMTKIFAGNSVPVFLLENCSCEITSPQAWLQLLINFLAYSSLNYSFNLRPIQMHWKQDILARLCENEWSQCYNVWRVIHCRKLSKTWELLCRPICWL